MSENIIPYRDATEDPGRLQGDVALIVHTRHALTLARGRKLTLPKKKERFQQKNPRIPGLIDFGRQIQVVCMAAGADDPLADWMLIRVEEAMEKARVAIAERLEQVMKALNARPSVRVTLAQSEAPVKIRLAFGSPYTYQAAYLIEDYDRLCMAALTATHVALMRKDAVAQIIESCASQLRGVLSLPFNYAYRLLTRTDVRQGNQRALQAMALLSEVPVEVMSGERRGMYAPEIKVKGSRFVDDGRETAAAIMSDDSAATEEPLAGTEDGGLAQEAVGAPAVVVVKTTRREVVKSISAPLKGL